MSERKQERPFDPARAARLDDPARFEYLPPADVLALLAPEQGASLLDFGAGTATYAIELARLRPDLRIVAYDAQPEMLELARAKPEFDAHRIDSATPNDLARLRGTFDRIFAINVLHEIDDVDLIAMRALMADDGRCVVIDWEAESERTVGPPKEHTHTVSEAIVRLGAFFSVERAVRFPNHFGIVVGA